jgi:HSP20 family protein
MMQRYVPTTNVSRIMNDMDRLFTEPFNALRSLSQMTTLRPAIDLFELGDHLIVRALVPGATADDIDITLERNILTIRGRFGAAMAEEEDKQVVWYRREIGEGRFSESIALPVEVEGDGVEAFFKNGMLILRLPKVEQARTRKIGVQTGTPALKASQS